MRTAMSLDEFAALVQLEAAQIGDWAALGLLDPAGEGRFDDLDLLHVPVRDLAGFSALTEAHRGGRAGAGVLAQAGSV